MADLQFQNNAVSQLLSNVGPTDVLLALPSTAGALFPADVEGKSFMLTVEDTSGNLEVMECTHRAGDVLTVVRAREGTSAKSFTAGAAVEMRVTAGTLQFLDWQGVSDTPGGPATLDIDGHLRIEQMQEPIKTYGDTVWNAKLGWTPVQQGGDAAFDSAISVKVGALAATPTLAGIKLGAGAAMQVVTRGTDAAKTTMFSDARFRAETVASSGGEDRLFMGSVGAHIFANPTYSWGLYHPTRFYIYRYVEATGNFDFIAPLTQNGTQVSVVGHVHAISNITGLTDALDAKYDKTGGAITGNVTVSGSLSAASVTDTSDKRIKRDISPMNIEDALAIVANTRAVRFFNTATNRLDFGVIADDQLTVTPELVFEDSAGMKSVAYQRMVAPLVVALQHALTRITALENQQAAILAQLDALEGGGV